MKTCLGLLAAALVYLPLTASAADLPVSYLVQEKPLKTAIAGTALSFQLYSDSTCTTLVQSVPVNIENVTILSKLKAMTPKNGTKLPNTVEVRTTLTGVTASGGVYLKVTGTGVVAVGSPCQVQSAQASSVAGTSFVTFLVHYPAETDLIDEAVCGILMGGNACGLTPLTAEAAVEIGALRAGLSQCTLRAVAGAGTNGYFIPAIAVTNCVATCFDGIQDYTETDVDCGGDNGYCPTRCDAGKKCDYYLDCSSNACVGNVCQP